MQVSIETTTGLERRLTVGVPAERVDNEVDKRLKEAAGKARIDGFRPGKAPLSILRQRYGQGIRQEVIGEVVQSSFYEAVVKEELQPAGQPAIEPQEMARGKDLQYVATFEVYPNVSLGDLSVIQVEKPVAEVTEADVDRMVEGFRKQKGGFDSVERVARQGDQLDIDYAGTRDGEPFDGGSAEGSALELGSGQMIPGFEDGLVGAAAGDERVLNLTFPADYHSEELKGAAVQFSVAVNAVKEPVLAALDAEFFAQYGVQDTDDVAVFRKEIAKNMALELDKAVKGKVKQQVMDQLVDGHDVQLPLALVQAEISTLKKQMFQQFGQGGADLDESILPDNLFTEQAERRVALGLLVGEYIKREELEADPERVRSMIEAQAATYQDPESVVNYYYGNEELLNSVRSATLEDAAVDQILQQATLVEVSQSYEEALAPPAQIDDVAGDEAGEAAEVGSSSV